MSSIANVKKSGECEACDKTEVKVTLQHGSIWMCEECWKKEEAVITRAGQTNQLIQSSKAIDESLTIKTDLFNAATVAAIELKAAIEHDENIAADQKQYEYAKVCQERMAHMQKVIFEQREALINNESIMRMWQVQVQETAGKLRAEQREHFKQLDIQYQPAKPKTVKPASTPTPRKLKLDEVKKYAAQYGVSSAAIHSLSLAKNISPEEAAKTLHALMN